MKAKVRVFVSNISSPPLSGDIKYIGFRIFFVMHEGELHVFNKNLKCIFTCNKETYIEITSCLVIMDWDFVVLSLIYFRTASIMFDLKNLNLSKHFERLWKDS